MLSTIFRLADAIQGHAGHSVASIYRYFDLGTLARGVAAIPVLDEKSNHQIDGGPPSSLERNNQTMVAIRA
jgi:hypothetical protein